MNWRQRVAGSVVCIDAAPLIYFMEHHPWFYEPARAFFSAADRNEFRFLTSIVIVPEVMVYPLRNRQTALIQAYRQFFTEYLPLVPVTGAIAEIAARLRADYNLRTPDALQIATAIDRKAPFFLTNDDQLPRVTEVEVLVLSEMRKPGT